MEPEQTRTSSPAAGYKGSAGGVTKGHSDLPTPRFRPRLLRGDRLVGLDATGAAHAVATPAGLAPTTATQPGPPAPGLSGSPGGMTDFSLSSPSTVFDTGVNMVAGNLSIANTDLSIASIGPATTIAMAYDSSGATTDGPFGLAGTRSPTTAGSISGTVVDRDEWLVHPNERPASTSLGKAGIAMPHRIAPNSAEDPRLDVGSWRPARTGSPRWTRGSETSHATGSPVLRSVPLRPSRQSLQTHVGVRLVRNILARLSAAVLLSTGLAAVVRSPTATAAPIGNDYPTAIAGCHNLSGQSVTNCDLREAAPDTLVDPWTYYNRECVSFVAWRLSSHNGYTMPNAGSASNWGSWADSHQIPRNSTPAPGAVAWYPSGHVAWVQAVSPDGSIAIEQYNNTYIWSTNATIPGHQYSSDTLTPAQISKQNISFIHFKDLAQTPPPVSPDDTPPDGGQSIHADFNGDGKTDVAAFYNVGGNGTGARLWVWYSTGSGFAPPVNVWTDTGFTWSAMKPVSGDFNGDGKTDVAAFYNVGGNGTGARLWVWYSTGSGFAPPVNVWTDTGFTWSAMKPVSGDFNGDGKTDVAAFYNVGGNGTGARLWVWYSTGSGFAPPVNVWTDTGFTWSAMKPVSGDFNGDGKTDVAAFYNVGGNGTGARLWVWYSTGSGFAPPVNVWTDTGFTWSAMKPVSGDFNGDGKTDVAAFYNVGGNGTGARLWVWYSTGSGFAPPVNVWTDTGFTWSAMKPVSGDFNGDGKTDVAAFYNVGGNGPGARLWVWYSTGSGFAPPVNVWTDTGFTWSAMTAV